MSMAALRPIRVGLCVEGKLVREALAQLLQKEAGIDVVLAVGSSEKALNQVVDATPEVLLIDSQFSKLADVRIIESTRQKIPELKVVMVGMDQDKDNFLRSARAGISGFLLKDASAVEAVTAIHAVFRGDAVCPPQLCLVLFDCVARQCTRIPGLQANLEFGLTRREQELLQMISCGLSNKQIASDLNISDQTVKRHVHEILHKIGATDRLEAVEVCRRHGMCAPEVISEHNLERQD